MAVPSSWHTDRPPNDGFRREAAADGAPATHGWPTEAQIAAGQRRHAVLIAGVAVAGMAVAAGVLALLGQPTGRPAGTVREVVGYSMSLLAVAACVVLLVARTRRRRPPIADPRLLHGIDPARRRAARRHVLGRATLAPGELPLALLIADVLRDRRWFAAPSAPRSPAWPWPRTAPARPSSACWPACSGSSPGWRNTRRAGRASSSSTTAPGRERLRSGTGHDGRRAASGRMAPAGTAAGPRTAPLGDRP